MYRGILTVVALLIAVAPLSAAGISGKYVEARTCDVWTGACFANAETGLAGKHAVMAWKVESGTMDNVVLDGLGVVAVIATRETLGLQQTGPAKAILIVDSRANEAQRAALVRLAKQQGGEYLRNILDVQTAPIDLNVCACKEEACFRMQAGSLAKIETRCIDAKHDKACGHEQNYYPPLAKSVKVRAAIATEHSFSGQAFNETWKDADRRGAYVGSFELR